jgi:hypothetical protein
MLLKISRHCVVARTPLRRPPLRAPCAWLLVGTGFLARPIIDQECQSILGASKKRDSPSPTGFEHFDQSQKSEKTSTRLTHPRTSLGADRVVARSGVRVLGRDEVYGAYKGCSESVPPVGGGALVATAPLRTLSRAFV